jgi:hypothetical protein
MQLKDPASRTACPATPVQRTRQQVGFDLSRAVDVLRLEARSRIRDERSASMQ